MRTLTITFSLICLSLILFSLTEAPRTTQISIRGVYQPIPGERISISLYNIDLDSTSVINSDRKRFEFMFELNQRAILTLKTNKGKAKSIFIDTRGPRAIEQRQQFLLSVGMEKNTSYVFKRDRYTSKCAGIILYNPKKENFKYEKSSAFFKELLRN